MKIYMAGPLFSTAECDFNTYLAGQLRLHGHDIFLPQEHEQRADRPDLIFKSDVAGINWADMVLANLDGPDPDSGTCWELGYGFAKDKYIFVYRTDFRLFEGSDQINLMMTESAQSVFILPKMPVPLLAERIDHDIRARWPKMSADQFGGFTRDEISAPSLLTPFTPLYRHSDK